MVHRYRPERRFPPYAFLPGIHPHPTRDPRGHSFRRIETATPYRPPGRWRENGAYLWGVDLYNHGFVWEAHEAWETAWRSARTDDRQRAFLQGLILAAAACVKCAIGNERGMERLGRRAAERLEDTRDEAGDVYMGLRLSCFTVRWRGFLQLRPPRLDRRPPLQLDDSVP